MKKIVLPVDFSKQSENALKMAVRLASKNDAEILALHMLELSPAVVSDGEYIAPEHLVHLIRITEKRFEEFLDNPMVGAVKITPIIKHYKVFSEVNEIAEENNADLIVMGSNGSDGLEELFVGSNTERVVRTSEVPVLVVKGEVGNNFIPKRFVFACDFKEENIPAAKKALEFSKMLGTELKMVFINTPADAFLSTEDAYKRINKFLNVSLLGLEVEIYNDYSVEKGVLNYAETNAADLIGIPTHGRQGLSHFFMGSIGEDVANHSKIPVVTFKI